MKKLMHTQDANNVGAGKSVPLGKLIKAAIPMFAMFTVTASTAAPEPAPEPAPPSITSATYNASTGELVVTGSSFEAASGDVNDVNASKLTFTGEGGATYTLTDTANVEIDTATQFSAFLSATDSTNLYRLLNKNGASSNGATTYNLAAADDFISNVTAGDTADLTGNGITVSNANNAPTDISLSNNTLAENSPIGTVIGSLTVTDVDENDTATFSFCGGASDDNFTLAGATLQSNSIFDYESTSSQSVCIKVSDSGSLRYDKTLTVNISNVNDNSPAVTSSAITAVNENSPYNYSFSATDADGDALSWSVKSGTTLPSWLSLGVTTGTDFELLGLAGFSAGAALYSSLAIDSSDTPYVAYQDSENGNKATVMKYENNAWIAVGTAGFSAGNTYHTSLVFDSLDAPYVAYQDSGNSAGATVMKYDGNAWVLVGTAGFSGGYASSTTLALDSSDRPYVAYQDGDNSYKATVMRFDGTNWEVVGTPGFSAGMATSPSLALDSSGTPYVAYKDSANGDKTTVMKYDGNAWVSVGTAGFSAGYVSNTSLAIDSSDRPYVVYYDGVNGGKATVMMYKDNVWVAVGAAGFSASYALSPSLALDISGTPYVAYKDSANSDKATVMKYDGSDWVTVGAAGFSAGSAAFTSLALDSSGTPYVAYQDNANGDKATVMKIGDIPTLLGNPGNAEVGEYDIILSVSDGVTTADQSFTITVANVNDAPTDISLSANTVAENSAIGTAIGTLTATDIDTGDTAVFSFCAGTHDGNFTLTDDTLQSAFIFDYESTPSQSICITVTDTAGLTFNKTLTVNITNINEAPAVTSSATTAVNEDIPYSYSLSATDVDGDALSWSVKSGTTLPAWLSFDTSSEPQTLGAAGFSASEADYTSLALDSSGIPYVAYKDYGHSGKTTVMKFDGSAWLTVGAAGFSAGNTAYTSLALDSSGTPYVAYTDYSNEGKATVMKYNTSTDTWETVGAVGFSAGSTEHNSLALDNSGAPYVAYRAMGNSGKATVMKYNGSDWVAVGAAGFSASYVYDTSLALDSSGTPYVAYQDGGNSEKATVMKFDGIEWVAVGEAGFSAGVAIHTSLALDSSGTPSVAYRDVVNSYKATMMQYNANTEAWETVGAVGFSADNASYTSLALDSSGTPYVAYIDTASSDKATLMKFDGSDWVTVGAAGFSAGVASYTSLALDSSGTPYVAYQDEGNSNKATVMKLVTSTLSGTPTNADIGVHDITLVVSDGVSTVDHVFQITVANVNDAPTDISLSNNTLAENSPIGTVIGSLIVTDIDANDTAAFSFCGGTDDDNFTLDGATLQSNAIFDYENLSQTNNIYQSVCIAVSDNGGLTHNRWLKTEITNVNDNSPAVASTAITVINQDTPYSYSFNAIDADIDTLSWSLKSGTTLPTWLSLDNLNGHQAVGAPSLSAIKSYNSSLALDSSDTLYVAYMDASLDNKASVIKFDGNNWVTIGAAGFSASRANNTSLALDSSGTPYVAYWDYSDGSYEVTVMKFDGNNWVTVGATGFINATNATLALDSSDTPYVLYSDRSNYSKATLVKFDGNNWITVGAGGFSTSKTSAPSLALDSSGTPYVAYSDSSNDSKVTVMTFDGSNWITVGTGGVSLGKSYSPSLALDNSGTPYVAYADAGKTDTGGPDIIEKSNSYKATVMKYNASTDTWVTVGAAGFSAAHAGDLSLALDSSDNPYVAYVDNTNDGKTTVMKFDGSNWVAVGIAAVSKGSTYYNFLVVDSSDTPYVLYADYSNDGKITVMEVLESTLSGTPNNADVGVHDITLVVSDGVSSVEHAFQINVANVNDAPTDINLSNNTLAENSPIGSVVGSLTVTDIDANDTAVFSFCGGTDDGNFAIADATLQSNLEFDYESTAAQSICISVTDSGSVSYDKTLTVNISNVNEDPIITLDSTLSTNEDSGQTLSFTYTDVDGDMVSATLSAQASNGIATVSGSTVSYVPGDNFNGSDSFTLTLTDSAGYTSTQVINVTVNSVNDAVQAVKDTFEIDFNDNSIYLLDVLSNDSDIDGDALSITGANTSTGTVTTDGEKLTLTTPAGFLGQIELTYSITDGNASFAATTVELLISGEPSATAPVITVPEMVEVNATGLYTRVNLGAATALNSLGKPLAVSLVDGQPVFKPGKHIAYWQAIDPTTGLTSIASQQVIVHPIISLGKAQVVVEGKVASVDVILNGNAPSYPVIATFSVSGSADGSDYDIQTQAFTIESGTQSRLLIDIVQDNIIEGDETLMVSLDEGNVGNNAGHVMTIVEINVAPKITLKSSQSTQLRQVVTSVDGLITVQASVLDINDDNVSTDWVYDASLNIEEIDELTVVLDPSELSSGIYPIGVTATDDGRGLLSTTQTLYLEVLDSLVSLTDTDSDGDLIPDNQEGYGDSDQDGIPDFLDAISECNVMPQQVSTQNGFLVEGDPGVCLRKGNTLAGGDTGGVQLTDNDLQSSVGMDDQFAIVGGIFDFIARDLPQAGQNSRIVLPQRQPIPSGAVYRKYSKRFGWGPFVEDVSNQLHSAPGELGYCPSPADAQWSLGLTEGDWCVRLTIEDGGPNDNDGIANNTIVDPGGVSVALTDNTMPVAQADNVRVKRNTSLVIDVLANDTDADGDILSIGVVTATFGEVTLTADNQLNYQSKVGFVGQDTLVYTLSDGNGGSDSGTVSITVYANEAPVALDDSDNTDDRSAIIISVLENDSDADGDSLTVFSATVDEGSVTVNENNTLTYTPDNGFDGTATISYTIDDGQGEQAIAQVLVTVNAYQNVTVNNKSKGGSMGLMIISLIGVTLYRMCRKKNRVRNQLVQGTAALLVATSMSLAAAEPQWFVTSSVGISDANSHVNIPSDLGITYSDVDKSSPSYTIGGGVNYDVYSFTVSYEQLGDVSASYVGDTLDTALFHQALVNNAPKFVDGISLQGQYTLWQDDALSASIGAGLFAWALDYTSQLNDSVIKVSEDDIDLFYNLQIAYALTEQVQVSVKASRYSLAHDINNVALGLTYYF
ncbi:tandem-95 repeat protein [Colwellia sp. MB02u-10]|uniref:tandem-95 repeat protein n=1 Tax=Colwellia sp. MB02u-10 TaxID=2759828 RepID=UPI0015F4CC05|nr:tandem-95 repeat protein [Colwellia sp. MB02u-10]MBA6340589.1 tandem-95 repeat protein [Colwellia sp. MB02u-10]